MASSIFAHTPQQIKPMVSIVLATYNGEEYLPEQLDSIFAQTYPNIELIVIDDKSTDGTLALLTKYAQDHTNMQVHQNEKNVGYIKNFEKGCGFAHGKWIAFCDQDDYWMPQKIERLTAEIGGYPLIYSDSEITDKNLRPKGKKVSDAVVCMDITNCLEYAIYANGYGHTMLFTKNLFDQYPHFPVCIPHDWWIAFVSTLHGGAKFLPETLVKYRQHEKNAFGIIGGKGKKSNRLTSGQSGRMPGYERIKLFYEICPSTLAKEKDILKALMNAYSSSSFCNNCKRMYLFFKYHKFFLAVKKRSLIRNYLFCLKMFAKSK